MKIEENKLGSTIKYANIEWIVLDKRKNGVLLLSKNILFNRVFDTDGSNNWAKSSLREELNNFNDDNLHKGFKELEKINKNDLVEFKRDLTTDDGMTEYGKCKDYISLISCEEYRKYRKHIPNASDWWWTLTAESLAYEHLVRFVNSIGSLYYISAYYGNCGVRPLIMLKNGVEV